MQDIVGLGSGRFEQTKRTTPGFATVLQWYLSEIFNWVSNIMGSYSHSTPIMAITIFNYYNCANNFGYHTDDEYYENMIL